MEKPLKHAKRYYLVDEDEYSRFTKKPIRVGPVLNAPLARAKRDVDEMTRVVESSQHPAIKARENQRLVNQYFTDLENISQSSSVNEPNRYKRYKNSPQFFDDDDDDILNSLEMKVVPEKGETSKRRVSSIKKTETKKTPSLKTNDVAGSSLFDSDAEEEERERHRRRERVIKESRYLPAKNLRNRVISPKIRRWTQLERARQN